MSAEGDRKCESNNDIEDEDSNEQEVQPQKKQKYFTVRVIDIPDELRANVDTDQTIKFPVCSSQGNHYLMTMCEMDSNSILLEPMMNKT